MTPTELQNQIKTAMREHDREKLSALRQVLQAIRQIEVDEQRKVTDTDVSAATKKLIRICTEEADALKTKPENHQARITMLQNQIEMLKTLLPQQIEGDALDEIINTAIEETNATTMRDMGRVMASIRKATNGECDMSTVSAKVKARLQ